MNVDHGQHKHLLRFCHLEHNETFQNKADIQLRTSTANYIRTHSHSTIRDSTCTVDQVHAPDTCVHKKGRTDLQSTFTPKRLSTHESKVPATGDGPTRMGFPEALNRMQLIPQHPTGALLLALIRQPTLPVTFRSSQSDIGVALQLDSHST